MRDRLGSKEWRDVYHDLCGIVPSQLRTLRVEYGGKAEFRLRFCDIGGWRVHDAPFDTAHREAGVIESLAFTVDAIGIGQKSGALGKPRAMAIGAAKCSSGRCDDDRCDCDCAEDAPAGRGVDSHSDLRGIVEVGNGAGEQDPRRSDLRLLKGFERPADLRARGAPSDLFPLLGRQRLAMQGMPLRNERSIERVTLRCPSIP